MPGVCDMTKMITDVTLSEGGQDLETIDKATNTVAIVKPRYGNQFKSIPLIAKENAENNMFQPFLTEADLLAYVPVLVPTVAKALDTHKVWFYGLDPNAIEIDKKPEWYDTGLSEKDLAIAHSDAFTTDVALSVSEQTSAEFHNSDENPLEIPLIVSNGDVLLAINGEGEVMNPAPRSISFEFHNVDNNIKSEYVEADENGFVIEQNNASTSIQAEFHNSDEGPSSEYTETDENGFVIQNEVKSDSDLDTSKMQLNEKDLETGAIYKSNDLLKVARDYTSDFYNLSVTNSTFSTYSAIYAIIDSWMAQYPDYIFKSSIGNDDWGNPIYKYEFLSPRLVDDGDVNTLTEANTKPPRILLNSGTHGVEREAVLASVMFMNNVVNNWRENDDLALFRWATDIIFVPIVNPSGYNANTRENKNNVDINRDGLAKTQTETNLFLSVLDSYTDVDFCVDHHNSYDLSMSTRPFWVGVDNAEVLPMCRELVYEMSCYIKKEFNLYTDRNTPTSKLSKHIAQSLTRANEAKHGVPAILLETPRQGGTSILSLKNRRVYNLAAVTKTMSKVRKFILNKQFTGATQ